MPSKPAARRHHGFTLVEMTIPMAITVVIVALVVQALVAFDRDQAYRTKILIAPGQRPAGARVAPGGRASGGSSASGTRGRSGWRAAPAA